MNKCEICNTEFDTSNKLCRHIEKVHNIDRKDYYDKYLKKDKDGICLTCGNDTSFIGFKRGYRTFCSCSCAKLDPDIQQRTKQTNLERYGVEVIFQRSDVIEKSHSQEAIFKARQTMLNNYGVKSNLEREDVRKKCYSEEAKEKRRQTNLKQDEENNIFQLSETKEKSGDENLTLNKNETNNKNLIINRSKQEENIFNLLLEKYDINDIIRQYSSNLYPFKCDFYIKSLDLYIECNFHWIHNTHWFDKNDPKDKKILKEWKKKAKTSDYYKKAIETWTIRDINKKNILENNNLNYLVFWDYNDSINYIKNML